MTVLKAFLGVMPEIGFTTKEKPDVHLWPATGLTLVLILNCIGIRNTIQ